MPATFGDPGRSMHPGIPNSATARSWTAAATSAIPPIPASSKRPALRRRRPRTRRRTIPASSEQSRPARRRTIMPGIVRELRSARTIPTSGDPVRTARTRPSRRPSATPVGQCIPASRTALQRGRRRRTIMPGIVLQLPRRRTALRRRRPDQRDPADPGIVRTIPNSGDPVVHYPAIPASSGSFDQRGRSRPAATGFTEAPTSCISCKRTQGRRNSSPARWKRSSHAHRPGCRPAPHRRPERSGRICNNRHDPAFHRRSSFSPVQTLDHR